MQEPKMWKTSGVVLAFMLLVASTSGCSKKKADEQGPVTVVPEAPAVAAPEQAPPRAFEIGDDFNRVERPERDAPSAADARVPVVTGAWSTFRGNDARAGLRDVPSIQSPTIRWRTEVGIFGYSNVIAERAGVLYASTQGKTHAEPDEWDGVVALNAADGKTLWRYRTESDANGMTLHGDTLYAVTRDGHIHAIDAADGAPRWTRDLECSMRTAPTIVGDYVHLLREGRVVRLHVRNGAPETTLPACRRLDRGGLSYDDGTFAAAAQSDRTRLYQDGVRQWTSDPTGEKHDRVEIWTPPLLTNSLVLVQADAWPFPTGEQDFRGDEKYRRASALVAYWREGGERVWVAPTDDDDPNARYRAASRHHHSLPLVVDGKIFAPSLFGSAIRVFDLATGERAGRVVLPDCRGRQFASLVGTRNTGYYARHDGLLYAFDYDTLSVRWGLSLGKASLSGQQRTHAPTVDDSGCTMAPTDGTALFATPTIGPEGDVYVGSGEGWIYAIGEGAR